MPWHDSSSGQYFLTMVVHERTPALSTVERGSVRLSDVGEMCERWWAELTRRYPTVAFGDFVIMPDHIHAIVDLSAPGQKLLGSTLRARPENAARPPLAQIVRWFKTMTTNDYIRRVQNDNWEPFAGRLWQRNNHERLLRTDADVDAARRYIQTNPEHWLLNGNEPDGTRDRLVPRSR